MPIVSIDELENQSSGASKNIIPIDQMENHPADDNNIIDHPKTMLDDAMRVPGVYGREMKNIAQAVTHPLDVIKSGAKSLFDHPIDNLVNTVKNTTPEKVVKYVENNPIGTISTVAGGLGVGGSIAKGLGKTAVGDAMIDAANVPGQAVGELTKEAAKGAQGIAKAVPQGLKQSSYGLMNSIVKQLPKEFRYGQNAGRGAVKEGITGTSAEDIANQASQRIKEIGPQGDALASTVNTTDNYNGAIKVIDNKIAELTKNAPRENASTIKRLDNAKKDLLGVVEDADGNIISQADLSNMTPKEALDFKRKYEYVTQWKGIASDDSVVNSTLQASRRAIKDQLNKNVPGLKEWNDRYGDLATLKTAAQRKAVYEQAGGGLSGMIEKGFRTAGGITAMGALAHGNVGLAAEVLGGMAAKEIIGSPYVKSNVAQFLYKLSEVDKAKVFQAAPWVKSQYKNIMTALDNKKVSEPNVEMNNPNYKQPVSVAGELPPPQQSIKRGNRLLPSPSKAGQSSGPTITPEVSKEYKRPAGLPFYSADESGRIKGDGFLMGDKKLTAKEANDQLIMNERPLDDMGNMESINHEDQIANTKMRAEWAKQEIRTIQDARKYLSRKISSKEFSNGEGQDIKQKVSWAVRGKEGMSLDSAATEFFGKHPELYPKHFNGQPGDALREVIKDLSYNRGMDYIGELRGIVASAKKIKK